MTSEDVRRALNEVGLPETATLADLIRHHRAQAALAAALEALAVSTPEPEWEYGVGWVYQGEVWGFHMDDEESARTHAEFCNNNHDGEEDYAEHFVVRRLPARSEGKWQPLPTEGEA